MNEVWILLVNNFVEIVFALIGMAFTSVVLPWIAKTVIPWLKEKRIYSLAQRFVKAAEKKSEAGSLARHLKKDYVVRLLKNKGVEVTEEVDAFIEAAVKELDTAIQSAVFGVGELMEFDANDRQ